MFEIATERGVLRYRMPNVIEAYKLLEASGIHEGNTNVLRLKGNIIGAMSHLVDYSAIEGVTSYEDLLNDVATFIGPIGAIADAIIEKTFGAFGKKN